MGLQSYVCQGCQSHIIGSELALIIHTRLGVELGRAVGAYDEYGGVNTVTNFKQYCEGMNWKDYSHLKSDDHISIPIKVKIMGQTNDRTLCIHNINSHSEIVNSWFNLPDQQYNSGLVFWHKLCWDHATEEQRAALDFVPGGDQMPFFEGFPITEPRQLFCYSGSDPVPAAAPARNTRSRNREKQQKPAGPPVYYNPSSLFKICTEAIWTQLENYNLSAVSGDVINKLFAFNLEKQTPQLSQKKQIFKKGKKKDEKDYVALPVYQPLSIVPTLLLNCESLVLKNRWQDVTDRTFEDLLTHKSVFSTLDLQLCQRVTDTGIANIFALRKGVPLLELNLRGCYQVGDASLKLLTEHVSHLQRLDLAGLCVVSDVAIAALLGKCTNLRHLDVQSCQSFGKLSLQALPPSLVFLDISFTPTEINPEIVQELSKLKNLEELIILQHVDSTGTGIAELVDQLPKLKRLSAEHVSGLKRLPGSSSLLYLNLKKGGADNELLEALQRSPNLTELDIGGSEITGATIAGIAKYNKNIKSLTISGCHIGVKDLEPLAQLKLDELNVNYCWTTKDDEERKVNASLFLNFLKTVPTLRSLWAENFHHVHETEIRKVSPHIEKVHVLSWQKEKFPPCPPSIWADLDYEEEW